MSHTWIEYNDPASRGNDELYVSLSPKGRMVFARRSVEALEDPQKVVMLFDAKTRSIGVRPAVGPATNGFRLQPAGPHGAKMISIAGFMRKNEIVLDHTVRFPLAHIDEGILVLDLHTRAPVHIGGRRKA